MNTKSIFIVGIILSFLAFLNACKKQGCTNKGALNYNKSAGIDDGSCEYCDTIQTYRSYQYNEYSDWQNGSPYYSQKVISMNIITDIYQYEGNSCRKYGKNINTSYCNFILWITNKVSNKSIRYTIYYYDNFGNYVNKQYTLPPSGETYIPIGIDNGCNNYFDMSNSFEYF